VRLILGKAMETSESLPRPQSIQCRAKGIDSLRRRLTETGKLQSEILEGERRDLAGVRIIFYTNNDVERFLQTPVIYDNFQIEEDSTKFHHPTPENKGVRYRAIHFTVKLKDERIRLPEYSIFVGLRCEIQIQTILNHAWSETSHDILYKDNLGNGFGEKALKDITHRFERIMDQYLIPAGYEIQKAQHDYERVVQGKELFDKDIAKLLDNAKNNNERYEILLGLKEYALPHYDDYPAAYAGLKDPLLRTITNARSAPQVSIETVFGNTSGFKVEAVTSLVLKIIASLRTADVVGTLQFYFDVYRGEKDTGIRKQIENAVKTLCEYNFNAYKQVGVSLQEALLDHLASVSLGELDSIGTLPIIVWTETLQSDITGSTWKSDTVVLSTGSLPVSEDLKRARTKALDALFAAYDRSATDARRLEIVAGWRAAERTPNQGKNSDELLRLTLKDALRIITFVIERSSAASYELLQHLEHHYLYEYFRACQLATDKDNRFQCKHEAQELVEAIIKFRDIINADAGFVRYKVLVGFESVYPPNWDKKDFLYDGADEYRAKEVDRYIEEISPAREDDWFRLINRCAETKSDDLATFPVFGSFINKLAQHKPEIAARLLAQAADDLRNFLPGFLNGLAASEDSSTYERMLAQELESGRLLSGVALHFCAVKIDRPDDADRLLKRSIELGDARAVNQCLLFGIENFGTGRIKSEETYVRDALTFLNEREDSSWVYRAWFLQSAPGFFAEIPPQLRHLFLANLGFVRKISHEIDHILGLLAKASAEEIWDYFGQRLARKDIEEEGADHFEDAPFRLHGLEKKLSKNPQLAVRKGFEWFARDKALFQYKGGRLLSAAFPNCTAAFAIELASVVKEGGDSEVDFALAILRNFHGEPTTFTVLQEVISKYSDDVNRMREVANCLDSTGVVSGELGFANAWRAKKKALESWLPDERETVKLFAQKHIAELDRQIADEHRRAETRTAMRKLSFGEAPTAEAPDSAAKSNEADAAAK
jgi:ppGpp synthetase/RelA/SpoT-type nucleotidyltranferase